MTLWGEQDERTVDKIRYVRDGYKWYWELREWVWKDPWPFSSIKKRGVRLTVYRWDEEAAEYDPFSNGRRELVYQNTFGWPRDEGPRFSWTANVTQLRNEAELAIEENRGPIESFTEAVEEARGDDKE